MRKCAEPRREPNAGWGKKVDGHAHARQGRPVMRRLLALSLPIVLAGCPPSDLCANVICKDGKICEGETGNCIGDGGTPDSGSGGGSGGGTATGGGSADS